MKTFYSDSPKEICDNLLLEDFSKAPNEKQ